MVLIDLIILHTKSSLGGLGGQIRLDGSDMFNIRSTELNFISLTYVDIVCTQRLITG